MPIDGRAGKVELLYFSDRAEFLCGCQHAVVANQRCLTDPTERGCGKIAAELAAIAAQVVTGLGRHQQLMARFADTLVRSLQQRFGRCARIRTANCFALLVDGDHQLKGVAQRQAENRAEQVDHKILRGVPVIMKNELNVAGLNAVHRKLRK
jgi:23S rRNA G2445 N2-methylase RlmL